MKPKYLTLNLDGFGERLKFAMIPPSDLKVDKSYQRDETNLVETIGKNFNPLAFAVAIVAERPDGTLYLVDAQQRTKGAVIAGKELVPCIIHKSDGRETEAKLFKYLNVFRRNVTPIELFNAALTEGDEEAVAINKAVLEAGFKIARRSNMGKAWPYIAAIEQLKLIFSQGGPEGIEGVLNLVNLLWPQQDEALRRESLRGLYLFRQAFGVTIDHDRLKERLKGVPMAQILALAETEKARWRRKGVTTKMYQAMFYVLRRMYGLKIPPPDKAWPSKKTSEE